MRIDHFGRRVAEERDARRWSQHELARRAGVVQSAVSMIENGQRPNPSAAVMVKLAAAFGMSVDALLADTAPVERVA